ncbi:TerD family protein [Streptomyces orinoci]|uniref:TerD family protein n=1 Tax=Streptomyces orinoci TaxID=67339 RepID=A0ABV3K4U4_STRON|nr:TerD family protein [Streptomyces orinoci]
MGVALPKGGNVSLSKQAHGLTAVTVGLGWQVGAGGAGFDLDASALLCDASGKVLSDQHFVFFNNLRSPDGSVVHTGTGGTGGDNEQIQVDLTRVPAEVARIVFPVSIYEAAQRGQNFGQLAGAHIRVIDQHGGTELARFDLKDAAAAETAMVFGELYRHGAEWKFRAIGQGYASGLAGIATDYGVDVLRESTPAAPAPTAPSAPTVRSAPAAPVSPAQAPAGHAPTLASAPAIASAPTLAAAPMMPGAPAPYPPQQAPVNAPAGCFFDPSHGPGTDSAVWSPQWGVSRPVEACPSCAQRVRTTTPPFYAPPANHQPPVQQGYPQQPGVGPGQQGQQGRRFGTGALLGAGAAGLVGGALLDEALSDD